VLTIRGNVTSVYPRCTSTPAPAVIVSPLWCEAKYRQHTEQARNVTLSRVPSTLSRYGIRYAVTLQVCTHPKNDRHGKEMCPFCMHVPGWHVTRNVGWYENSSALPYMCRHRVLLPPSYVNFFSHPYSLKVTVFADGTPYSPVENFHLGETPSYSRTVLNYNIRAGVSSKTAQNFYQIRRCYVSEASTHDHSSGEVKFYLYWVLYSIFSW
jgi:hypothetical protein